MRITNGMLIDGFLINMQNNLTKMNSYTQQLATGRKMVRISDDPVGLFNALTSRQRLDRYEQYNNNLTTARKWVEQADTSLQELSAKLTTIYEEVIDSATDLKNEGDRENIRKLMIELKGTLKDALNVTVGDQYLFAGYNVTGAPITETPDPNNPDATKYLYNGLDLDKYGTGDAAIDMEIDHEQSQRFTLEVGYGMQMEVSMTAIDVVGKGENNLFNVCDRIIGLMKDNPDNVVDLLSAELEHLQNSQINITSCIAVIGAMEVKVDTLEERYSEDILNYNDIRSRIEDIDTAETAMEWKTAESIYKQSLATGARVIMPTLMDFLN